MHFATTYPLIYTYLSYYPAMAASRVNDTLSVAFEELYISSASLESTEPYIEKELSCIGEPIQFGLRATHDFQCGAMVSWYGGKLEWATELRDSSVQDKTHVRRLPDSSYVLNGNYWASRLKRPIPKNESELISMSMWTADKVQLECFSNIPAIEPLGWLANSPGISRTGANVAIAYHQIMQGLVTIPYLRAVRHIERGDPILCWYGNERTTHTGTFVSLGQKL